MQKSRYVFFHSNSLLCTEKNKQRRIKKKTPATSSWFNVLNNSLNALHEVCDSCESWLFYFFANITMYRRLYGNSIMSGLTGRYYLQWKSENQCSLLFDNAPTPFLIPDDLTRPTAGDSVIPFNRIKTWFSTGREYYYSYLGYNAPSSGLINTSKFCLQIRERFRRWGVLTDGFTSFSAILNWFARYGSMGVYSGGLFSESLSMFLQLTDNGSINTLFFAVYRVHRWFTIYYHVLQWLSRDCRTNSLEERR